MPVIFALPPQTPPISPEGFGFPELCLDIREVHVRQRRFGREEYVGARVQAWNERVSGQVCHTLFSRYQPGDATALIEEVEQAVAEFNADPVAGWTPILIDHWAQLVKREHAAIEEARARVAVYAGWAEKLLG